MSAEPPSAISAQTYSTNARPRKVPTIAALLQAVGLLTTVLFLTGGGCGVVLPMLQVSKSSTPASIELGTGNVTYEITVTNDAGESARDLRVEDAVPPGFSIPSGGVTVVEGMGMCGVAGNAAAGHLVTCVSSTELAAGQSFRVRIVATPTQTGMVTNSATVTVSNQNGGAGTDPITVTATTDVTAPPGFTCTAGPPLETVVDRNLTDSVTCTGGTQPLSVQETSGLFPGGNGTGACAGATVGTSGDDVVFGGAFTTSGSCDGSYQTTDSSMPPQQFVFQQFFTVHELLQISTPALADGADGDPYIQPILTTGGKPPITFSLAAGSSLPSGFMLDPSRFVSGTTTQGGSFTFTVDAQDSLNPPQVASQTYTIHILKVTTTSLASGVVGQAYADTLAATGLNGPAPQWSLVPGTGMLPPGLLLDPASGAITGIPTQAGIFNFDVQLTQGSRTATQSLGITITGTADISVAVTQGEMGVQPVNRPQDIQFTWTHLSGDPMATIVFTVDITGTPVTINSFVASAAACSLGGATITCNGGPLAAGDTNTLDINFTPTQTGQTSLSATYSSILNDLNLVNNQALNNYIFDVITAITLNPADPTLQVGDSLTFTTVSTMAMSPPANFPNQFFQWSSSDPSIATVDGDGVVTGLSPGTVTITATVVGPGGGPVSGSTSVTVTAGPPPAGDTCVAAPSAGTSILHLNEFDATGNQTGAATALTAFVPVGVAIVQRLGNTILAVLGQNLVAHVMQGCTPGPMSNAAQIGNVPQFIVTNPLNPTQVIVAHFVSAAQATEIRVYEMFSDQSPPTLVSTQSLPFTALAQDMHAFVGQVDPTQAVILLPTNTGIFAMTVNAAGNLTFDPASNPLAPFPFLSVVSDLLGGFLFTTEFTQALRAFQLDPQTGVPAETSNASTGSFPAHVAFLEISGMQFLVVSNSGDDTLDLYQFSPVTGQLLRAATGPFPQTGGAGKCVPGPFGTFLYCLTLQQQPNQDEIVVYLVDLILTRLSEATRATAGETARDIAAFPKP